MRGTLASASAAANFLGRRFISLRPASRPPYFPGHKIHVMSVLITFRISSLLPHFSRVLATDVSEAQVEQARRQLSANNVDVRLGSGEQLQVWSI